MHKRATALLISVVGAGGFASTAEAAAGDHIRFAPGGTLTPSLGVLTTYRTNNYLTPGLKYGEDETDAAIGGTNLSIRPGLDVGFRSNPLRFNFKVGYEARRYFKEELQNLNRYKNVNVALRADVLPTGPVGVKLDTGFAISGRETEAVNAQDAYLQQMVSRTSAMLSVRPGKAMEVNVGGVFEYRNISVPDGFAVGENGLPTANLNTRDGFGLVSDFSWQFLPKTAIVASFERINSQWGSNAIAVSGQGVGLFGIEPSGNGFAMCNELDENGSADCFLPVPDGVFTTFDAGIRGRFTEKVVVGAVVGFAHATFDASTVSSPLTNTAMVDVEDTAKCDARDAADGVNDELNGFPCSLTGNVEVGYEVVDGHTFTGGFLRDVQPVFFTNYMMMNRWFVGYRGLIADRHQATVSFDVNQQGYRGQVNRDDLWYRARADMAWGIQKWLSIDTGVWYTGRRSVDGELPEVEYDDVNIHAGLTLTY